MLDLALIVSGFAVGAFFVFDIYDSYRDEIPRSDYHSLQALAIISVGSMLSGPFVIASHRISRRRKLAPSMGEGIWLTTILGYGLVNYQVIQNMQQFLIALFVCLFVTVVASIVIAQHIYGIRKSVPCRWTDIYGSSVVVFAMIWLTADLVTIPLDKGLANDIERTHVIGTAIEDREDGWDGHVEYASWLDDETIVYWSKAGTITCRNIDRGVNLWELEDIHNVTGWSVSRKQRRLAIQYRSVTDGPIRVVDCANGTSLFEADKSKLGELLNIDFVILKGIALTPLDARLIICERRHGGYVLDSSYSDIAARISCYNYSHQISVSPDESRISLISNKLCIRDLETNKDILRGTRMKEVITSGPIDAPFVSHVRHDGKEQLVYSIDNSWKTGTLFLYNLKNDTIRSYDGRNGHIELDVNFDRRQIALTGTSTDLTVLDLDGKTVAHKSNATLQRNSCVEFSPSGKRILVGSWDNTVSVFEVKD